MAKAIVKLADDKYVEWSSVVDAPVSCVMSRKDMREYLHETYGMASVAGNLERLDRADEHGTSFHTPTPASAVAGFNRAGPNETKLSLEEIIKQYSKGGAQYDQG